MFKKSKSKNKKGSLFVTCYVFKRIAQQGKAQCAENFEFSRHKEASKEVLSQAPMTFVSHKCHLITRFLFNHMKAALFCPAVSLSTPLLPISGFVPNLFFSLDYILA